MSFVLDAAAIDDKAKLTRLLMLVTAAQRYHDSKPSSARRSARAQWGPASCDTSIISNGSIATNDSSLASPAVTPPTRPVTATPTEQWDLLRLHIEAFWQSSHKAPREKYDVAKKWLGPMRLWDTKMTWVQCHVATAAAQGRDQHARHLAVLRSLPHGKLFL
jgi:hypothetical protein